MSTREIVTWQIGVDLCRRQRSAIMFLRLPRWSQDRQMTQEQRQARLDLGSDSWSYWVRRGWDDTFASGCKAP